MPIVPVIAFLQSAFQDSEDANDLWFGFLPHEVGPIHYLVALVGLVLIWLLCRVLYTTLLYNRVGANKHPANFRKLIWGFGLLLSMIFLDALFLNVFGIFVPALLGVAWLICVLVFVFTRRKVASPQS